MSDLNSREATAALPVDRYAGGFDRQSGGEDSHSRDIEPLLAELIYAPGNDFIHQLGIEIDPVDGFIKCGSQ
ncbi:MAG: hypothetical protein STSR0003_08330 [Smithella sp.]